MFIKRCIAAGRVRWTYHVTMRFKERKLSAAMISEAIEALEIIEAYPTDKYLPSYLVRGEVPGMIFHVQIATDVEGENVRVVTMYIPDAREWDNDYRARRAQ